MVNDIGNKIEWMVAAYVSNDLGVWIAIADGDEAGEEREKSR